MTKTDPDRLLVSYAAGVRHPETSGMEHLNLLQIRSTLAASVNKLTAEQCEQLRRADGMLLASAAKFLHAIQGIADLEAWRAQENTPSTHWWWYLDVIVHLPRPDDFEATQEDALEAVVP